MKPHREIRERNRYRARQDDRDSGYIKTIVKGLAKEGALEEAHEVGQGKSAGAVGEGDEYDLPYGQDKKQKEDSTYSEPNQARPQREGLDDRKSNRQAPWKRHGSRLTGWSAIYLARAACDAISAALA